MSISCFTVSQSCVQVCAAGAVWKCLCYLLCDLTSSKVICRETGLPSLDSWKEERVPISSVCTLDTESLGAPGLAWLLPPIRAHVRPVGNPTEAEVPDMCLGTHSWGSDTLGFPELLGEDSLVPSQLSNSKQLLRSRQFLPAFLRTVKSHFCLTHVPRISARIYPRK